MNKTPKTLAILGPTASGKTALALHLAQYFPIEIISLDSALVYQGMDIGTAKPSLAEQKICPHHLIDIITPLESYSAAQFSQDCTRLCQEIEQRGNYPVIVGGTMMYFHALTQGLNDLPEANESIRQQLQTKRIEQGIAALYQELQQCDPITAARLEPNDSQRIERALEVFQLTGKPLSQHFAEQQTFAPTLQLHTIALIPQDRKVLHQHIAQRFHKMLEQGFLEEVCHLQQHYPELTLNHTSMRCVGYRQAWEHLAGEYNYQEMTEKGIAATRQLAKRQLTWLRKLPSDSILDPYQDSTWQQQAHRIMSQHFQQK